MFLWDATFKETIGLRLESIRREAVVSFAAASTVHACGIFQALERQGEYKPYHKKLTSIISDAATEAWRSVSADGSQSDLSAIEVRVLQLAHEDPKATRKKCNENRFLYSALSCVRCAMGIDLGQNAAYAARYAYEAVSSWFIATSRETPKFFTEIAAVLAVERTVVQCVEEIKFQERCLSYLEESVGAIVPPLSNLIQLITH